MEIAVCVKPVPEAETRLRVAPDGTHPRPGGGQVRPGRVRRVGGRAGAPAQGSRPGLEGPRTLLRPRAPDGRGASRRRSPSAATGRPGSKPRPPGGRPGPCGACARARSSGPHPPRPRPLRQAGRRRSRPVLSPARSGSCSASPTSGTWSTCAGTPPGKRFRFQRVTEAGLERWEAPLPVVIGLQQAWNDPRTAKLPNILKSRKAPIAKVPADRRGLRPPAANRRSSNSRRLARERR